MCILYTAYKKAYTNFVFILDNVVLLCAVEAEQACKYPRFRELPRLENSTCYHCICV